MPPTPSKSEHHYTVRYAWPVGAMSAAMESVRAAYFVEEGALTVFKDSAHHAVFAVSTGLVVIITRGPFHDDEL